MTVAAQEPHAPVGRELAEVAVGFQHVESGIQLHLIRTESRETDGSRERLPAVVVRA